MNKSVVFFAACLIAVAIYMSYFGAGFSIKGNIDEPTNTDKVSFNSSGVSMSEKAMQ